MAEQRRGSSPLIGRRRARGRAARPRGGGLAYPSAAAGPATSPRSSASDRRRAAGPRAASRTCWLDWLPARSDGAVLVAVAASSSLAAIAGAVGLGLPGIRIVFGGPTPSAPRRHPRPRRAVRRARRRRVDRTRRQPSRRVRPWASATAVRSTTPRDRRPRPRPSDRPGDRPAGRRLRPREPRAPSSGPSGRACPPTRTTASGCCSASSGAIVDDGYYQKTLYSSAQVTPVTVNGHSGYWISGAPHFFYYVDPSGKAGGRQPPDRRRHAHLGGRRRHVPARIAGCRRRRRSAWPIAPLAGTTAGPVVYRD